MIRHVWTVLCSQSIIDRETNNLSLIEVLEQITVVATPVAGREGVIPLHMEVVTSWVRTVPERPARGRSRLSFVRPSGVLAESIQEHEIDLSDNGRLRHRIKIAGLTIKRPVNILLPLTCGMKSRISGGMLPRFRCGYCFRRQRPDGHVAVRSAAHTTSRRASSLKGTRTPAGTSTGKSAGS